MLARGVFFWENAHNLLRSVAAGGVAEFIEHAQVEVCKRHVLAEIDVAAGLEGAATVAGEYDGQVVVIVAVAIGNTAAVNDHRVVQQGFPVHIFCGLHFLKKVGELPEVEFVDLRDLLEVVLVTLVVRDIVVAVVDADVTDERTVYEDSKFESEVLPGV